MGTVQKRADELKIGDVITMSGERHAVLGILSDPLGCNVRVCILPDAGVRATVEPTWGRLSAGDEFPVESPDLTPAQQHAEELYEAAHTMFGRLVSGAELYEDYAKRYAVLLDKIKPPEPPTLAEALEALVEVEQGNASASPDAIYAVKTILDRARRAGVL